MATTLFIFSCLYLLADLIKLMNDEDNSLLSSLPMFIIALIHMIQSYN